MTKLLIPAAPSATYRLTHPSLTIPYWLYLRILHLLLLSPFSPGTHSSTAFVTSHLRSEGYEVSAPIITALVSDYVWLDDEDIMFLHNLDPDQMRPRYNEIPFAQTRAYMESITPYLTVSGSITGTAFELGENATAVSDVRFGLVVHPSNVETSSNADTDPNQTTSNGTTPMTAQARTAAGSARPHQHTPSTAPSPPPRAELIAPPNFDLSQTSTPITEFNYSSFLHSTPQSPSARSSISSTPPSPPNDLPSSQWPRAPAYGTPHIDAFTGLEIKTVHKPIMTPFDAFAGAGRANFRVEQVETEIPLLGEYKISSDSPNEIPASPPPCNANTAWKLAASKALSAASSVKDKLLARANTGEIPDPGPFSRWSVERLSYERVSSGADGTPSIASSPASDVSSTSRVRNKLRKASQLITAAANASFPRILSSRSERIWERVRSRSRSRKSARDTDPASDSLLSDQGATSGVDTGGESDIYDLQPTPTNLLRLRQQGFSLAEIKSMCRFVETEEEMDRMWWQAVARGETLK